MKDLFENCIVCQQYPARINSPGEFIDGDEVDCPNCGVFQVAGSMRSILKGLDDKTRANLSNSIWTYWEANHEPYAVGSSQLMHVRNQAFLSPFEQLEKLILYLGSQQSSLGLGIQVSSGCLRAKIAAFDAETERYLLAEAKQRGLVDISGSNIDTHILRLTLSGWEHSHEIVRYAVHSTQAFMAMPFIFPNVTEFIDTVFRPAVQETGFTLKRLDDAPEAGVINNRMRVEIRQSKFMIAELTHENRGAYWEAGFAEGLGKPVIYTCERSYFETNKTHFDTNHCTTVVWDATVPEKAAEDLKATIRNTFPIEAKMPKDS